MVAPTRNLTQALRSRISKSGQVTLPAKVRQQMGIDTGEQIEFVPQEDGTFSIRPVRILSVEEIAGRFGRPVKPEELQEALEESRREGSVRQRYKNGSTIDDLD